MISYWHSFPQIWWEADRTSRYLGSEIVGVPAFLEPVRRILLTPQDAKSKWTQPQRISWDHPYPKQGLEVLLFYHVPAGVLLSSGCGSKTCYCILRWTKVQTSFLWHGFLMTSPHFYPFLTERGTSRVWSKEWPKISDGPLRLLQSGAPQSNIYHWPGSQRAGRTSEGSRTQPSTHMESLKMGGLWDLTNKNGFI